MGIRLTLFQKSGEVRLCCYTAICHVVLGDYIIHSLVINNHGHRHMREREREGWKEGEKGITKKTNF